MPRLADIPLEPEQELLTVVNGHTAIILDRLHERVLTHGRSLIIIRELESGRDMIITRDTALKLASAVLRAWFTGRLR